MNHSHVLYDSDPHFKIDPISRKLTNESSTKIALVQNDHNSERFTFEMPRYIEGHDMSVCDIVQIHYLNVESNTKVAGAGVYTVDDLHVKDGDEDTVVCSWLVGNGATQLVGQLQFLVRFACSNEKTGKVDYVWNTGVYSGIAVSSGIYNTDSPSDNIVPPYNFVTTVNGETLKFFVGTKAEFNVLTHEEKQGVFAIITDDDTQATVLDAVEYVAGIKDGTESVELANKSKLLDATVLTSDILAKAISISQETNTRNGVWAFNLSGDSYEKDANGHYKNLPNDFAQYGKALVLVRYDTPTVVLFSGTQTHPYVYYNHYLGASWTGWRTFADIGGLLEEWKEPDANHYVWFSGLDDPNKAVYSNLFQYNPAAGKITVPYVDSLVAAAECDENYNKIHETYGNFSREFTGVTNDLKLNNYCTYEFYVALATESTGNMRHLTWSAIGTVRSQKTHILLGMQLDGTYYILTLEPNQQPIISKCIVGEDGTVISPFSPAIFQYRRIF